MFSKVWCKSDNIIVKTVNQTNRDADSEFRKRLFEKIRKSFYNLIDSILVKFVICFAILRLVISFCKN